MTQMDEPTIVPVRTYRSAEMVGDKHALSEREFEVARAYADGQSYKQIARAFGIAPATVRAHVRTIYRKLGVGTKIALGRELSTRPAPRRGAAGEPSRPVAPVRSVRIAVNIEAGQGATERTASLAFGLTEDLVFELTRFHRLIVLSATASAGRRAPPSDFEALPPAADFQVTGTLRQSGDRLRLAVALENLEDGQSVWADRFEAAAEDFFRLCSEILGRVAATILGQTEAAVSHRAARRQPASLAAYECVMRGKSLDIGALELEARRKALFVQALEIDPDYALAHALLAHALLLEWDRELEPDGGQLDLALMSAKRAVSLDPGDPYCQYVIGFVHLFRKSFDIAEEYYRRVAELSPNDAELVAMIALFRAYAGEPERAFEHLDRARRLDPNLDPSWLWHTEGLARFVAGEYTAAVSAFDRSATSPLWIRAYQVSAAALDGRSLLAKDLSSALLEIRPQFRYERFVGREPLRRSADRTALQDGLRRADLPP